jgi:hypothetical protein
MRELDGHPSEVSVAEHYDDLAGLTLAVADGPVIAPSPPAFEGAEYLHYERGDRPRPEDVSMQQFSEGSLTLFNDYRVGVHGAEIEGLPRKERAEVVSGGTGAAVDVFDATEYDADTAADTDTGSAD